MADDTAIKERETPVVPAERTRGGYVYRPNVDIIEKTDALLLLADMPGTEAENVEINFEQGVLSVYARVNPRQEDDDTSHVIREYGVGDYARSFRIGEGIDSDKIEAEFSNGVLTLHLPKTAEVMPKKISVKAT